MKKKKPLVLLQYDIWSFSPFHCIETYIKINCDSFLIFLLQNINIWTHPFPIIILKKAGSCSNFGCTKHNQKEIKCEIFTIQVLYPDTNWVPCPAPQKKKTHTKKKEELTRGREDNRKMERWDNEKEPDFISYVTN